MKEFWEMLLVGILYLIFLLACIAISFIPLWFMYKICQGIYHILLLLIDKI